jgi:integrase
MQIKGSECLNYYEAMYVGNQMMEEGQYQNFGLLIICGINMGLRISDLLTIEYGQLKSGKFLIKEKKTDKGRIIVVNSAVKKALSQLDNPMCNRMDEARVFTSSKGTVYSPQHVNRLLKNAFEDDNISSHSLRKGFGRRFYEIKGQAGLSNLQKQFNHSDPETTLNYIGITQEELNSMYEEIV